MYLVNDDTETATGALTIVGMTMNNSRILPYESPSIPLYLASLVKEIGESLEAWRSLRMMKFHQESHAILREETL